MQGYSDADLRTELERTIGRIRELEGAADARIGNTRVALDHWIRYRVDLEAEMARRGVRPRTREEQLDEEERPAPADDRTEAQRAVFRQEAGARIEDPEGGRYWIRQADGSWVSYFADDNTPTGERMDETAPTLARLLRQQGQQPPAPPAPQERLHPTEPAVVVINGRPYGARDHFAAIQKAMENGEDIPDPSEFDNPREIPGVQMGFQTEAGRFLTDQEALDLAKQTGQYRSDVPPSTDAEGRPYLDSADLVERQQDPDVQPVRPPTPPPAGIVQRAQDILARWDELVQQQLIGSEENQRAGISEVQDLLRRLVRTPEDPQLLDRLRHLREFGPQPLRDLIDNLGGLDALARGQQAQRETPGPRPLVERGPDRRQNTRGVNGQLPPGDDGTERRARRFDRRAPTPGPIESNLERFDREQGESNARMAASGVLPPDAQQALARVDNLGFGSATEAANAILQHADWATRWDVRDLAPEEVATLERWRAAAIGTSPAQAAGGPIESALRDLRGMSTEEIEQEFIRLDDMDVAQRTDAQEMRRQQLERELERRDETGQTGSYEDLAPPNLTINPDSPYAGEDPAALYVGARSQARGHMMRSLNAQAFLEAGVDDKGKPLTPKARKQLEAARNEGARMFKATLDQVASAFDQQVADALNNELVAEGREYVRQAKAELQRLAGERKRKSAKATPATEPPPAPKPEEPRTHQLGEEVGGPIGAQTQLLLSNGQKLTVRYRVVEAAVLRASHDPFTFAPTPGYPAGIQGRDYQRNKAAQETVRARALEFDAETALNPSRSATEGQPVILPDGTVVAGNERSMLVRLALQLAPARYAAYREQLLQRATEYGVTEAEIRQLQQPVLVREIITRADLLGGPARWAEINRLSDQVATKAKSAVEEGAARAAKLQQAREALRHFAETIEAEQTVSQYLGTAHGRAFVKQLLDAGVITKAELGRMTGGEGVLTADGREAIRQMLLAAAVRDPAVLMDAPPSIVQKLEHAVPNIVALRGTPFDPSRLLTEALRALAEAKDKGITLRDLRGQGDLLAGERAGIPELVYEFAVFLHLKSKMAIAQAFRRYATLAREAIEASASVDMFGGTGWDPPTAFRDAFEIEERFDGELGSPARRGRGDEMDLFGAGEDTPLFNQPREDTRGPIERMLLEGTEPEPRPAPAPVERQGGVTRLPSDPSVVLEEIPDEEIAHLLRLADQAIRQIDQRTTASKDDLELKRLYERDEALLSAEQDRRKARGRLSARGSDLFTRRGKFSPEEVSQRPDAVQAEEGDLRGRTEYAPGQREMFGGEERRDPNILPPGGYEELLRRLQQQREKPQDPDQGELLSPAPAPDVAAPAGGRPYTLAQIGRATERELAAWLRWEERLAMRELLEREDGAAAAPAPGQPSKSVDELVTLENELQAVEHKLREVKNPRVRELLEAQLFNRLRQQEAYVREYFAAGRLQELPEAVRVRFPDIARGTKEDKKGDRGRAQDEQRRRREEWERRMRERAERERQERERRAREDRERQERRGSGRRQQPPPPPPPPPRPPRGGRAGPAPSMEHPPGMTPPKSARTPVLSLIRIGRKLEQALGAKAFQGRFNAAQRQALGIFKVASEAIRLTRHEWLDVRAHEVGHFLSKRYLGHPTTRKRNQGRYKIPRAALKELLQMGKNLYGSRRPGLGYAEEGIAEWVKFYVTNPTRMWAEAPEFTKWMESGPFRDTPLLEEALGEAREHYARYRAATPLERIKAQVARRPARFSRIRLEAWWRTFIRHWFDDTEEIRRFDRAVRERGGVSQAHVLAKLSRGAAGTADNWLSHGMVDLRDGRRAGRSVADVLAAIGNAELEDFQAYLMAESALERWEWGINPGIEQADARAVVQQLAPKYRQHAEVIWQHYNLLLQARRDAGMLTYDAFERIRRRNKRHVGFYRLFEEYELPAGGGRGTGRRLTGSGLHAQTGSSREILGPLESIVSDTHDTASAIARFRVGTEIIRASLDVEGMGPFVDEVPAPIEAIEIRAPEVLEQLRALGLVMIDPQTGQPRRLERDDLLGEVLTAFQEMRRPGAKERKDLVIPYERNGVRRWFQIGDRPLYDALEGLGPQGLPEWARWWGKPTRAFRAGVTLTVRFILKNIVRDSTTAFIRTRSTRFVLPFEHLVTGVFAYFRRPDMVHRWQLEGGDNATLLGLDRRQVELAVKRYARRGSHAGRVVDIVKHPVDTIRMLGSIGENLTRLGEFAIVERQALKAGKGPREAARLAGAAARDVTQDFAVAGVGGRAVNQLATFFNAHVNSVANLVRDMAARPEVVIPRIIAGVTLPSIWLAVAQRDDEEYQRIPRWQKDIFWIYIQRNERGEVEHRWFIPKPFEIGVIFGSIPERMAEWVLRKDPRAWDQTWESIRTALVPNIMPPTLLAAIETWANKDTFRNRPIVPRSVEKLEPREQAARQTGETARVIGRAVPGGGLSPAKLEHFWRQHFGTLGMAALQVSDAGIRAFREATGQPPLRDQASILRPDVGEDPLVDVPALGTFVGRDPKENAEDIERIYREFEAAESKRLTWLYMLKEGRSHEAALYLRQNLAAIRSVATREMTNGTPGPLRYAHELIGRVRRATRAQPDQRERGVGVMHGVADAVERALRP